MTQVRIAGGSLVEYDVMGPERDGTPFVLIEGLGAHYLGWRDEFCQPLVDRGHPVIRLDNRDAGLSQAYPGAAYVVADMADDVRGLIDMLGLDRVHVVGQSMGGMIAQELVIRHPSVVASLALFYTAPSMDYLVPSSRDPDVIRDRPNPTTRAEWVEQYVLDESECASPSFAFDADWKRVLAGRMWDRSGIDKEGTLRQRRAIERSRDRLPYLRRVDTPTVVFHGTADALVAVEGGRAIAEAIDGSLLHVYEGMNHELPRELWPEFIAEIVDNADRSTSRSGSAP